MYIFFYLFTDDEARKKLRDYFQKTHRELTTNKSGAAGSKKRKCYLYDRMLFSLPFLGDRSTTTNVAPLSSDEDVLDSEDSTSQASTSSCPSTQCMDTPTPTLPDETNNQDPPATRPVRSDSTSQPQQSAAPRRPKLFPQHRAQQSQFEFEMLRAAQRVGEKKVETVEIDEDEHFFKSLIPKIKLLNTVDKMKCQAELHMVVLKYVEAASNSTVLQREPGQQATPQTPVYTSITALAVLHEVKIPTAHKQHTR